MRRIIAYGAILGLLLAATTERCWAQHGRSFWAPGSGDGRPSAKSSPARSVPFGPRGGIPVQRERPGVSETTPAWDRQAFPPEVSNHGSTPYVEMPGRAVGPSNMTWSPEPPHGAGRSNWSHGEGSHWNQEPHPRMESAGQRLTRETYGGPYANPYGGGPALGNPTGAPVAAPNYPATSTPDNAPIGAANPNVPRPPVATPYENHRPMDRPVSPHRGWEPGPRPYGAPGTQHVPAPQVPSGMPGPQPGGPESQMPGSSIYGPRGSLSHEQPGNERMSWGDRFKKLWPFGR